MSSYLDDFYASLGGTKTQAQSRASAIQQDAAAKDDRLLTKPPGWLDDWSSSLVEVPKPSLPAASPASAPPLVPTPNPATPSVTVRARAIPTAVDAQQTDVLDGVSPEFGGTAGTSRDPSNYSAREFAGDAARVAGGTLAGGLLRAPQGVEGAAKGTVRDLATGNVLSQGTPMMRLFGLANMALQDALGIRSMSDQIEDKQKAQIAVDRALSGVSIPGVRGLADYGDRVQKDILAGMSEEGKRRMAGAEPKGNIFEGEFSWGDDPTVAGYALQGC